MIERRSALPESLPSAGQVTARDQGGAEVKRAMRGCGVEFLPGPGR
jgi:hypothetical protein